MGSLESHTYFNEKKNYEWKGKQKLTLKNGRKCNLIEIQYKILFELKMI